MKAQRVKELALAFIIDTDQPFTTFSNGYFQEMLGVFDPSLAAQLAWGGTSFEEDLRKAFQAKKKVIKAEIEAALSTIHISFDLWTSPNRYAMIAIFAHFIDKRGRPQDLLLALRRQLGAHSGKNIATTLGEVIKDWGLDIFRSVVVSDNASNNDSCVAAFFASFSPNLTHEDIKARRIRCFGHILNLIAKAFFSGLEIDSFDLNKPRDAETDLQLWRKASPITKLHNIIKYIRASPQRSQAFKDLSKELESQFAFDDSTANLEVKSKNETRWNSTYLMIERAVRKQEELKAYMALEESSVNGLPPTDRLTGSD